jgi:hypothetical protein
MLYHAREPLDQGDLIHLSYCMLRLQTALDLSILLILLRIKCSPGLNVGRPVLNNHRMANNSLVRFSNHCLG